MKNHGGIRVLNNIYAPEGILSSLPENKEYISSLSGLERAKNEGRILESTALLCDGDMRLHVDLYGIEGIIEREESMYCPHGEHIKDIAIITRVGKPVCFKVISIDTKNGRPIAILSRRAAQIECIKEYLETLVPGDVVKARVTHMESFGAFVDIGCGVSSLLSVDSISVSRISHPSDRLTLGDYIYTVIKTVDESNGRIFVSMRELLGTWEENAAGFCAGQTVAGIVRSVENYGIFVELSPNLAGLAEIREGTKDKLTASIGQRVAVYIKSIIPDRMKIKLVLIDSFKSAPSPSEIKYFIDGAKTSHISYWRYSPEASGKRIETYFS